MSDQYQPPYQEQQRFNDPYGQSAHEGTIEETIHRTATKRVNHSRSREIFTPGTLRESWCDLRCHRHSPGCRRPGVHVHDSQFGGNLQITQLSRALTSTQAEVNQDDNRLTGQVSKMGDAIGEYQWSQRVQPGVSQYFTGADGQPHTFLIPCAEKSQ